MAEALIERSDLRVTPLPSYSQLLLHGEPRDAGLLSQIGEIALGDRMLRMTMTGEWSALHLSPDEWLLIGPAADRETVIARFANAHVPLSLVAIGERSLGVEISGPSATMLLNTGCPLDLHDDAFPAGSCTRTLFGKAAVMIWRTAESYRMQYGRSFDEYVTGYIRLAAEDLPPRSRAS